MTSLLFDVTWYLKLIIRGPQKGKIMSGKIMSLLN